MILTFSKPEFVEAITAGTKIHTIREDKTFRWRSERKIQFWKGNPRNVKSNPYQFGTGICTKVRIIQLDFWKETVTIFGDDFCEITDFDELDEFAENDGFASWDYMKEWFQDNGYTDIFIGKIIYFSYVPQIPD